MKNLQEEYEAVRLKKWGKNHVLPDPEERKTWCGRRWLPGQALPAKEEGRTCVECRDAWKAAPGRLR